MILNVQSLPLQGTKPTSILCLPYDGTNTETSICPTVKLTSPCTLAEGDCSVSYWKPSCVHQLAARVLVLKRLCFATVWSLLTTHFICQFPPYCIPVCQHIVIMLYCYTQSTCNVQIKLLGI